LILNSSISIFNVALASVTVFFALMWYVFSDLTNFE
jgi:hypothetical protein